MADDYGVVPPWRIPEPPPSVQEAEVIKPVEDKPPEAVESPVVAEQPKVAQPIPEQPKPVHKYRAVRGGGDPIYLLVEGKKHWVLNAETFRKLGYRFGEEEKIEPSELATYMPGKPITAENYTEFM